MPSMVNTEVEVTQSTDDVVVEDAVSVSFDETGLVVDEIPRFDIHAKNKGGLTAHILAETKEIEIRRAGELRFVGLVENCAPSASPQGRYVDAKGVSKWHRKVQARKCDSYDFEENGLPAQARDGVTVNPWHYITLRNPGSTMDVYGQEEPVDGVGPFDIAQCLLGSKFIYQHRFEDNSHLLASVIAQRPALADSSGNSHTLELNGPATVAAVGDTKFGAGYDFTPENYLHPTSATAFNSPTTFAVFASFKYDVAPTGKYTIVSADNSVSQNPIYAININSSNQMQFVHEIAGGTTETMDIGAALAAGTQYNIWFTKNDTALRLSINATVTSHTLANSSLTGAVTAGLFIGTRLFEANHFDGKFYEVRYWASSPSEVELAKLSNPADATYTAALLGAEVGAWYLQTSAALAVYRNSVGLDLIPKLQRVASGSGYVAGTLVHSIPLESGDPNIDKMGRISRCSVLLIGELASTQHPTIRLCRNAREPHVGRTYSSVTLTSTADYLGTGLNAWTGTGTFTLAEADPDSQNSLGYELTIPGTNGDTTSTKVHYIRLDATLADSDIVGQGEEFDITVEDFTPDPIVGIESRELNWVEVDLQGFDRLEALERVRKMVVSPVDDNPSPCIDITIRCDKPILTVEMKARRGEDVENHDYSFANENLETLRHEFYVGEMAFQTIAYGSGSDEAQNRIVSKEEFSAGGLYDVDRDPMGETRLYNDAPRVMDFKDNNETSAVTLLRKARAYHKLHRDPIENFKVSVNAEHLRYFEVGDRIRVVDLPCRANNFLRVVNLNRAFAGGSRERLKVELGEPGEDFADYMNSTASRAATSTMRGQPKDTTSGVSGNPLPFDKDVYGIFSFAVDEGRMVTRVKVKVSTVPYQTAGTSAMTQYGGATPTYGASIRFSIDPPDANGDGIPTSAEFDAGVFPATIGTSTVSRSVEVDITVFLKTAANGTVRSGEHKIYFISAANGGNTQGLAAVAVSPLVEYENG